MVTNIVFEGPDGSGKSTLIEFIHKSIPWNIYRSPGPDRSQVDYMIRVRGCLDKRLTIFDRHPAVSEGIYGLVRGGTYLTPAIEDEFYQQGALIIYCHAVGPTRHSTKTHDSPEHIDMIRRREPVIRALYKAWAMHRAHIIYRIGDDKHDVLRLIIGAL